MQVADRQDLGCVEVVVRVLDLSTPKSVMNCRTTRVLSQVVWAMARVVLYVACIGRFLDRCTTAIAKQKSANGSGGLDEAQR